MSVAAQLPSYAYWLWGANALFATLGQLLLKAAATEPRLTGDLGNCVTDSAGDTFSDNRPSGDAARARWRAMLHRPWLWLGVGCFVVEFLLWLAFVSLVPLSDGVLLGAINIVAVLIFGRWWFAEKLSPMRVAGILLISIGVAVVGLG